MSKTFLQAMANGKHRRGSGERLRAIVYKNELAQFGAVRCYCCGGQLSKNESTLEHISPQSLGGKTELTNLALSHAACNEIRANSGSPRFSMDSITH